MIVSSCAVRYVFCASVLTLAFGTSPAKADVVLLLAEPYGRSAGLNPTGHVGVYLTRVCAETPTQLRRCREGEVGAVVSRYNKIAGLDWAAIPLVPYLYGVERAADVPTSVTPDQVRYLRDSYRRAHLRALIPDDVAENDRHWFQLTGAVYDRQFIAFSVRTTPEQDDHLIAELNQRDNVRRFNLFFRNCADFARDLINDHFYPRAIRSNVIGDLGLTTPKQIAKALVKYGRRHPEAELNAYVIPQIPGNRPQSGPARGVLESFL
ncbi:MAG: hypothetical protein AB7P22_16030 [Vicinamibacterales bacterium]